MAIPIPDELADAYKGSGHALAAVKNGRRQMTYATPEAAERARLRLEKAPMPESLRASLEKNRSARANNPAKVAVIPYGGPYFTDACPACGVENKSRLRDAFLTGDN